MIKKFDFNYTTGGMGRTYFSRKDSINQRNRKLFIQYAFRASEPSVKLVYWATALGFEKQLNPTEKIWPEITIEL